MAIFQLFEEEQIDEFTETFDGIEPKEEKSQGGHLLSSLLTRGCFLLLLLASSAWVVYSTLMLMFSSAGFLLSFGKSSLCKRGVKKFFLMLRRSIISLLSLAIGLFSPPFGIMVACTYFLMYDKAGMDEVIPASFQAQVKEIFHNNQDA